jgi:hypothetical protein
MTIKSLNQPKTSLNPDSNLQHFHPQSTSLASPATLKMKILDSVQLIIVTSREEKALGCDEEL